MFGFCDKHTWPQNMKHQHHGSSHAEAGKSLSNTVCKYNKCPQKKDNKQKE